MAAWCNPIEGTGGEPIVSAFVDSHDFWSYVVLPQPVKKKVRSWTRPASAREYQFSDDSNWTSWSSDTWSKFTTAPFVSRVHVEEEHYCSNSGDWYCSYVVLPR